MADVAFSEVDVALVDVANAISTGSNNPTIACPRRDGNPRMLVGDEVEVDVASIGNNSVVEADSIGSCRSGVIIGSGNTGKVVEAFDGVLSVLEAVGGISGGMGGAGGISAGFGVELAPDSAMNAELVRLKLANGASLGRSCVSAALAFSHPSPETSVGNMCARLVS